MLNKIIRFYKNIASLDYKFASLERNVIFQNKYDYLSMLTLSSKESGITNIKYSPQDLVVSLTSYGRRILSVHTTIESLMQQSQKANRIILWLDDSYKNEILPICLQNQVKRGLEIRFCNDIKSYKKLIPTLLLCPEDIIITCDDDVIYSFDFIENLFHSYAKNPSSKTIYANRCHKIRLTNDSKLYPYTEWEHCTKDIIASTLIFPVGEGGILYPPKCFHKDVTNSELFMKLSPKGDDIWFKAMALLNGYNAQKVVTHKADGLDYYENTQFRDMGLAQVNVIKNQNDVQIQNVFDKYGLIKLL